MIKAKTQKLLLCISAILLTFIMCIPAIANAANNSNVSQKNSAVSAGAPIQDGYYRLSVNASWSRVVDIPNASSQPGMQACIFSNNNTNAQVYKFTRNSDNTYTITNKNSGLALDVCNGAAINNNTVIQYNVNGTSAQKWYVVAQGNGYYLKSALGNFVLDLSCGNDENGARLDIYAPNASPSQIWHFTPENEAIKFADAPVKDATYIISADAALIKALDIAGASKNNGANVQIYDGNNTAAQNFILTHDGSGHYTIKNQNSNLVLDAANGSTNNMTNVQQYSSNGTFAQKWVIVQNADGSFTIHNAGKKNVVLDIYGGRSSNGTNVELYQSNNTAAQHWRLFGLTPGKGDPGPRAVEDNWYNIVDAASGKVVDIPGGSPSEGATAQIYTRNNSLAQAFYFEWQGGSSETGWYKIYVGCGDNLLLAAKNQSVLPGIDVISSKKANDLALWSIIDEGQKRYLVNKGTGQYLSLCGSSTASGTKVVTGVKTSARSWSMKDAQLFTEGIYTISSKKSNAAVLDVPSGSRTENQQIQIYSPNSSFAQKWRAKKCSDGNFAFQSLASGLWIGVDNSGNVVQKSTADNKKPDESVRWQVSILRGSYQLTHLKSKKVLDLPNGSTTPGNKLIVYANNKTDAQCWDFNYANIIDAGTYEIDSAANLSKCLNVENASFSNYAKIQTYSINKSGAQTFVVTTNSDGSVSFKNARSKKCIDVAYGGVSQGQTVWQYDENGSNAQRWFPELSDDGYIYFKSALNQNYVLDAGACADGTNVVLAVKTTYKSQQFTLVPSSYEEINWSAACPFIPQNPELPWGCESVALTELLHGMGYNIGKTFIADNYLPYSSWDFVHHFAGNPYTATGIGCTMPPCIAETCNHFLSDYESSHRATVATGTSLSVLLERAQAGYPSVVWNSIDMAPVVKYGQVIEGYQAWPTLHAVCVCGYDTAHDWVLVCDPLAGKIWRPRAQFESIYNQGGMYAVVVD